MNHSCCKNLIMDKAFDETWYVIHIDLYLLTLLQVLMFCNGCVSWMLTLVDESEAWKKSWLNESTEWPLFSDEGAEKQANQFILFVLSTYNAKINILQTKCCAHYHCCAIIRVKCNHCTITYVQFSYMNSQTKHCLVIFTELWLLDS